MSLTLDDLKYLGSLVRMDIRKKERALEKFTPKPGQSDLEAETVRSEFRENLAFRRGVLWRLREIAVDKPPGRLVRTSVSPEGGHERG